MKKIFLLALTFSLNVSVSQTTSLAWARGMNGPVYGTGYSVAADAFGNVYSTGAFQGTVDFDPGAGTFTLASSSTGTNTIPNDDAFISKLDATGNFIWAKRIGDTLTEGALSIKTDAAGNSYVAGFFRGTVDFDPGPATSMLTSASGWANAFLLKLDPAGNFVWVKQLAGSYAGFLSSLALDAAGNIYMAGFFNGTMDLDPGVLTNTVTNNLNGNNILFISKLDAQGNLLWANTINSSTFRAQLAVDASGNVYATGNFSDNVDFDPGAGVYTLSTVNWTNAFVLKMDASGNFIWARQLEGVYQSYGIGIALDAQANVYTTGGFNGSVDFDPGPGSYSLTAASVNGSTPSPYISKLDAAGNFVWARQLVNSLPALAVSAAMDAQDNLFVTGYYKGQVDFDPGVAVVNSTSTGDKDIFLVKLDAAGNFDWMKSMGGPLEDLPLCVSSDAANSVYMTGFFGGTADFDVVAGTATLAAQGQNDIFVLKISQCYQPSAPVDLTALSNKNICVGNAAVLTASVAGTINWYTSPAGNVISGTGATFITPTLTAGTYSYYAEALTCTTSAQRTQVTVSVSACTGLESLELNTSLLSLSPNPFSGLVTVKLESVLPNTKIEVYNMLGALVLEKPVTSSTETIDLGAVESGAYFIRISNGQNVFANKKLLKH